MKVLNVYVLHYDVLKNRIKYINSTLEHIKKVSDRLNFNLNVKIITDPAVSHIEKNIDLYNKRVKFEKDVSSNADDHFNNMVSQLNMHEISNIEKHRNIYDAINNEDELHFIIEDDVVINQQYFEYIEEFFEKLSKGEFEDWDILFTCTASINTNPMELVPSRLPFKVMLSKSSYFIKPALAKLLIKYLEVFTYNMKVGLSKFIWDNKDVKSFILNRHTFMEGSKIGIFTSSIHTSTNYLYQNAKYVHLARMTVHKSISDDQMKEAESIYDAIKDMNNPDILHTMGLLYFKNQNFIKAKELMTEACYQIKQGNGIIAKTSEILNNAINIYQHDQEQLEEFKGNNSKYNC